MKFQADHQPNFAMIYWVVIVPVKNFNDLRHCLAYAAEARHCAGKATTPERRYEFIDMEQSWLRLAENYLLFEQLGQNLLELEKQYSNQI
jgi:hypothetical protein